MSNELRISLKLQHKLWYKCSAKKWKDAGLTTVYTELAKTNKKWLLRCISQYEYGLALDAKKQPKKVYAYIRSKQKNHVSIRSLQNSAGLVQSSPETIVNILNDQFSSVFSKSDSVIPTFAPMHTVKNHIDEFSILPLLDPVSIHRSLSLLDTNKACGSDGISPFVLKNCAQSLALPISLIYQLSITSGKLPEPWKLGNIAPIFKKGSRLHAANYRPVSLTSIPCKVLEKVIVSALLDFINKNNLLSKSQHGFVKNRTCTTNLLESSDKISYALARGYNVDVILLDFAKAFDKVWHAGLLVKLRALGVTGRLLNWIADFLYERKQRVVLGDSVSEWHDVSSGVPQGSVLGPILFILFINDMPAALSDKVWLLLYADDSKLISALNEINDALLTQQDLDKLVSWANTWLMELNLDKCVVIHFGNRPDLLNFEYTMTNPNGDRHVIKKSTEERDLGIQVTNDLKWHSQCSFAASKAYKVLGGLSRTFVCKETKMWRLLYTSLVRPHLEFASTVWNPRSIADINILENVQRRATRMCRGLRKLEYTERCKRFGITDLKTRRDRGDLIQTFKIIHGLESVNLQSPPQPIPSASTSGPASATRGHSQRLSREIFSSSMRNKFSAAISYRERFLTNRISPLWNALPQYVVDAQSLTSFKSRLDSFINA